MITATFCLFELKHLRSYLFPDTVTNTHMSECITYLTHKVSINPSKEIIKLNISITVNVIERKYTWHYNDYEMVNASHSINHRTKQDKRKAI